MNYGSGKFPSFGERLSTVGVWRYPKQMTWPSAVATTTLPLARSSPSTRPSLEPTNTRPPAIAGDESTRARVVNVQSGLPVFASSACSLLIPATQVL